MSRLPALVSVALLGVACSPAAPTGQRVRVLGEVRVPAGLPLATSVRLVSDRGSGVVSNNTGGVVSNQGGHQTFALRQLPEAGVEGARIFVADQAGNPIPGLPEGRTDAEARFTLEQVPAEENFVVVAEIPTAGERPALFRTIVQVGKFGATTTVSAPTTLVTLHVLEGLPSGALANFNPAKFQIATEATARNLRADKLPDFTDVLSIKASMAELVEVVDELKDLLMDVKKELAELKSSIEALRATPSPAPSKAGNAASQAALDAALARRDRLETGRPTPRPRPTPFQPEGPFLGVPVLASPCMTYGGCLPLDRGSVPASQPPASPTPSPTVAPGPQGCDGPRVAHTFFLADDADGLGFLRPVRPIGVRDVARVGVAYSGATTGRPEADIFASASLTAAGVTLDVPASCPLQVYVEDGLGAGWRESITVTAPADGGGVSTLP